MIFKILGAVLVLVACGAVGFQLSKSHKRTEQLLRQLLTAIEFIECELEYRLLPLPAIFLRLSKMETGLIGRFFRVLAEEMEKQISPNITCCMDAALLQIGDVPDVVKQCILLLSRSLGQFDVQGQLKGLNTVRQECAAILTGFTKNQDVRLRSYKTLAICVGALIIILFV